MENNNKIVEPTIFTNNKLFIKELLSFKYSYIILTFLLLVAAYIFNKNSAAEYQVYASMMATKNEASSVLQGSNQLFRGMDSFETFSSIEDGINKLRSFSMISSTLDELNFEIGYFNERKSIFKTKSELYHNTPFYVVIQKSHLQAIETKFYITILGDSTFRISADKSDASLYDFIDSKIAFNKYPVKLDKIYKFNEPITLNFISLTVYKNKDFVDNGTSRNYNYYFLMHNPDLLVKYYLKNFAVTRANPGSSIINISFTITKK